MQSGPGLLRLLVVAATLFASTTGTDADWVVKVIDVFPPEVRAHPELGGYQLMVSADILRGRYRESLEHPKAAEPGVVAPYRVRMPEANHTFLPRRVTSNCRWSAPGISLEHTENALVLFDVPTILIVIPGDRHGTDAGRFLLP